ncbi:hypothetical protein GQ44DRAFT_161493 [Phaeosphaeriaceae sp. PMI808]|nr:hypothetical protein GQ44DRAFT_161493 [Phaeosphaeriaceae sp. PMI808]
MGIYITIDYILSLHLFFLLDGLLIWRYGDVLVVGTGQTGDRARHIGMIHLGLMVARFITYLALYYSSISFPEIPSLLTCRDIQLQLQESLPSHLNPLRYICLLTMVDTTVVVESPTPSPGARVDSGACKVCFFFNHTSLYHKPDQAKDTTSMRKAASRGCKALQHHGPRLHLRKRRFTGQQCIFRLALLIHRVHEHAIAERFLNRVYGCV